MSERSNHGPRQDGISPETALPFKVRNRGRVRRVRYHSTRGTHHGDAMLTLVVGGTGYYRRHRHSQTVRAGMLGLVLPGHDPGILLADRHDPYDHFYCRFAGTEALRAAGRIVGPDRDEPFTRRADWQELADVFHRMMRSKGASADTRPERMTPVDAVLAELLALLEWPRAAATSQRITRSRLVRYMEEHISEAPDLGRMASFFAVSKSHLCRTAKPMLDGTIHRHWVAMRMAWARTLLEDDAFSVADVGRLVGYKDPFYFSKAFKQETGQSPRAWRSGKTPLRGASDREARGT